MFWKLLLSSLVVFSTTTPTRVHRFENPIDAISVGIEEDTMRLEISFWNDEGWSSWQKLEIEKEFDPHLQESNLIIFPYAVSRIRIRGTPQFYTLHPIRIPQDPVHFLTTARGVAPIPLILAREEWGAEEAFLFEGDPASRSDVQLRNGSYEHQEEAPDRVRECTELQRKYPLEFQPSHTSEQDSLGRRYRWALEYSPTIKTLVVHHTALKVTGDERSPIERVRALYAYHAMNRGWGDIGYNFLVDEEGQIYEGRKGGDYVAGGHAYCHNIGSIGVALLGNFNDEQPTLAQIQGLQKLLSYLAKKYNIDLSSNVEFRGKILPPITRHSDLVPTDCPGHYLRETLSQVHRNVQRGELLAGLSFSSLTKRYINRTPQRRDERLSTLSLPVLAKTEGLRPIGPTTLRGRPLQQLALSLYYQAGARFTPKGTPLTTVSRSDRSIGLWQGSTRIRSELILPQQVAEGNALVLRLKIQLPKEAGAFTLRIGDITYALEVEGRHLRLAPNVLLPTPGTKPTSAQSTPPPFSPTIRIRLGYRAHAATVVLREGGRVNRSPTRSGELLLQKDGDSCAAKEGGSILALGIIRLEPTTQIFTITSWKDGRKSFRGTLECRVLGGALTLINELPLEEYLLGLAEEPDSEPFEKQRAFAIAARSYAAYYLGSESAHRKFPGMPYDGSDDPAEFQAYGGMAFEEANPRWVQAVRSTEKIVVTKSGSIVKTPYFTSDDGRTRSPEERGWNTFPFAEVFSSKQDPWCEGHSLSGHGVGMSGCGARGQAAEGKTAEAILGYYYPGTTFQQLPQKH